jgi:tetratricopeptide (TPR) repeat protein
LGCLGQIYLGKKNKLKAADYFQEALSIARKIGERQMEGRLLAGLGLAKRRHSFDEAIKHFEQAVAIARETGDRQGEASHLGCLGTTWELFYSAQPEPPKPTEFVSGPYLSDNDRRYIEYREAVVRYEQACQAKYDKPIEYFKQALAIAREIGDKQLVENLSDNLGRLAGRPVGRSITVAIVTHHDRYVTAMTDEDHQDWALRAATKTLNDREKFTVILL